MLAGLLFCLREKPGGVAWEGFLLHMSKRIASRKASNLHRWHCGEFKNKSIKRRNHSRAETIICSKNDTKASKARAWIPPAFASLRLCDHRRRSSWSELHTVQLRREDRTTSRRRRRREDTEAETTFTPSRAALTTQISICQVLWRQYLWRSPAILPGFHVVAVVFPKRTAPWA